MKAFGHTPAPIVTVMEGGPGPRKSLLTVTKDRSSRAKPSFSVMKAFGHTLAPIFTVMHDPLPPTSAFFTVMDAPLLLGGAFFTVMDGGAGSRRSFIAVKNDSAKSYEPFFSVKKGSASSSAHPNPQIPQLPLRLLGPAAIGRGAGRAGMEDAADLDLHAF